MDVGLVCDSCCTFNPMGASGCSKCGGELNLDPPPPVVGSSAEHAAVAPAAPEFASTTCPTCGGEVPPTNKFCGACGHRMGGDETQPVAAPSTPKPAADIPTAEVPAHLKNAPVGKSTMFFSAVQQETRAKLVLIKGDGLDGVSFTLAGEEHTLGRMDAALLFEEDPYLSPTHANFFYKDNRLWVRDEGSLNGVYRRIRGTLDVDFGDRFLVGEQLIEIQETPGSGSALEPFPDGTYFYASPRRVSHFRLAQLLRGGDTGICLRAKSGIVTIGREGNDINFPDDPFISGRHARVEYDDGRLKLTDLGSKNGTFLRVNDQQVLEHGDYVFMGQQLLRVEIV